MKGGSKMDNIIALLKKLCDALDGLEPIIKIILCIPALHLVWALYRVFRSIIAKNAVGIVVSVILAFVPIVWLADLICFVLMGKIWTVD